MGWPKGKPRSAEDRERLKQILKQVRGQSKTAPLWRHDEEQFLRQHWETMSDRAMAEHLGRPLKGLRAHRERLGLTRGEPGAHQRRFWSPEERFWHGVKQTDAGCLIWNKGGWKRADGAHYGGFRGNNAHIYAYEMAKGRIPAGYDVHHTCGNGLCVNPEHLEAMPKSEHMRLTRLSQPRITHCKHGHPATPENRISTRKGHDFCRVCDRLRKRKSAK